MKLVKNMADFLRKSGVKITKETKLDQVDALL